MDNEQSSTLTIALGYAERGWPVFPLAPGSKKTMKGSNGFKDATLDRQIIKYWWTGTPDANIGIATGKLVVIDVDVKNGQPGLETYQQLQRETPFKTMMSMTPSGGYHALFDYPGDDIGCSVGIRPGLDIRGTGGYIVAPGSVTPEGVYQWCAGPNEPVALPDGLRDMLIQPNGNGHQSQRFDRQRVLEGVPAGERDDAIYKYACSLQAKGNTQEEAEQLVILAAENCKPPFDVATAIEKVKRAYTKFARETFTGWTDPDNFSMIGEHMDYPVDAFPDIVSAAVLEVTEHGKMPIALAAGSALAALSVAIQPLVDVARDSRLIGPCSLNLLVIAESGERKSTADRAMAGSIKGWEISKRKELEPEIQKQRALYTAWQAKVDGVKSAIKRTQASGPKPKAKSVFELQNDLIQLEQNPIQRPVELNIFHEETTAEGLAWHVGIGWPSQALWSDEGALVVGGQGMRKESMLGFLGLLNRLWDGTPFKPTRKVADTAEIRGKRFTSNLMVQPVVLQELIGSGPSRGVGNLARNLMAYPKSTMGERLYTPPSGDYKSVPLCGDRLHELLNIEPVIDSMGFITPPVIHLNNEARDVWAEFHDAVEIQMRKYGEFEGIKDVASKIADNAARIACLFHVFEKGVSGAIGADTMERAVSVATWYLNEARRVFGELAEPEHSTNARALSDWLASGAGGRVENGVIRSNLILRHGPYGVRKKMERDQALEVLTDMNHVRQSKNTTGAVLIHINPGLLK